MGFDVCFCWIACRRASTNNTNASAFARRCPSPDDLNDLRWWRLMTARTQVSHGRPSRCSRDHHVAVMKLSAVLVAGEVIGMQVIMRVRAAAM
jgi:hypothetical protein